MLLRLAKLSAIPHGLLFGERRPGLIILAYHRVGGETASEIDVPVGLFERQMAHLREHYTVVPLDLVIGDLQKLLAAGHDLIAVTFDDGSADVYEHAFPVLQRYQLPATVYLATAYIDERRPFDFGTYRGGGDHPQPLSWPQVREMAGSGLVTIGAHTHTHIDLTRVPVETGREELERSRGLIEDRAGTMARHFAYPWGAVTPAARALVAEYFSTGVRGGTAKNIPGTIDRMAMWRRPIQQGDGFALFRLKLRSYLDGEEALRGIAARWRHNGQERWSEGRPLAT